MPGEYDRYKIYVAHRPTHPSPLAVVPKKAFLKRGVPDSTSFWNSSVVLPASRGFGTGQSAGSRPSTPENGSFFGLSGE
jgi:hypothetical protein